MFQIRNISLEKVGLGHLRFEFRSLFRIDPFGKLRPTFARLRDGQGCPPGMGH
jgi:hypothetical protein